MLKLLSAILPQPNPAARQQQRLEELRQALIRHEAKVGGRVFGDVPKGRKRDFFCLDEHTWVWHEEWTDANGQRKIVSTRYDVRPSGILKSQNGGHYQKVQHQEIVRLHEAAKLYQESVNKEVYNFAS